MSISSTDEGLLTTEKVFRLNVKSGKCVAVGVINSHVIDIAMNAHPCCICQKREAHFLCFCSEARLCDVCIATHLLQNQLIQHRTTTLQSSDYIPSPSQPSASLASARDLIQKEIRHLDDFQADIQTQFQQNRTRLITEIDRTFEELSQETNVQINSIREELKLCLAQTEESSPEQALGLVRRAASGASHLLNLSFEFKHVELPGVIRKACNYIVGYAQGPAFTSHLYKFFGGANSVGMFNTLTEQFELKTVAIKFAHNACWCAAPSGEILVTGGSMTGRSRSTVLSYHPATGEVHTIAPMLIARRSHASICSTNYCYVFGGVLDEDRISLCECYILSKGVWSSLQQMKERRAYHGVCQYNDMLMICGGGETSSCESYSPETGEFRFLQFPDMGFTEATSALQFKGELLIFHGNFSGKVSRIDPETCLGNEEKQLCYGNSWSNCAPLLTKDFVYLLRSDSVFKYSLVTGESSYVSRLAKTAKRREFD